MAKILSGLVALVLLVPCRSEASAIQLADFSAAATTLDFEGFASGVTISSQFAGAGVSIYGIGNLNAGEDPSDVFSGLIALTITDHYRQFPGGAQVTGPFRVTTTSDAPDPNSLTTSAGTIGAQFIDPVTGNAATTNRAGAWLHINQWGPGQTQFGQVSAFGVDDALLGTVQLLGGATFGGYQFLGIGVEGIHRVEFSTGNPNLASTAPGFNIDDLVFEPLLDTGIAPTARPIPIPDHGSGLGLLSIGLSLLACVHVRVRQ